MLRTIFLTAYGAVALVSYVIFMYLWAKYYAGDWLPTALAVFLSLRVAYVVGEASGGFFFRKN